MDRKYPDTPVLLTKEEYRDLITDLTTYKCKCEALEKSNTELSLKNYDLTREVKELKDRLLKGDETANGRKICNE